MNLSAKKTLTELQSRLVEVAGNEKQIEIPISIGNIAVIFHKKNSTHVISQESVKAKNNFITLKRNSLINQTTVMKGEEVIEVIWKTP